MDGTGGEDGGALGVGEPAGGHRRRSTDLRSAGPLVIATKLVMPTPPPMSIDRRRLERLLDDGLDGPLTVIVAPAGYGKTVAAASRLGWDIDRISAWISLDSSDDEPARFWTYVVSALEAVGLEIPAMTSPVERLDLVTVGEVLGPLVNALAELEGEVTLAIDDLHLITSLDIQRQLAFLVEQRPAGLHLLLISRTEPDLLTPRLLASGNATRIGVNDLAFDDAETASFLTSQHVDPTLSGVVTQRLHGWPAALRLLCLWLNGQDDHEAAVAQFARRDDIVASYLATEVLAQMDPRLRAFLVRTSVARRLNGPLCDALIGVDGGAQVLADLHRRGLFVEAIETDNGWFRYHHLFGALLARELAAMGQAKVDELHRRASAWFAANGHAEEAIDHAIAARDWDALHALLLIELLAIGNRHHFAVIESWLAAVPAEVKASSATFLLLEGFILASTGRLAAARKVLHWATVRLDDGSSVRPPATIAALIVTVQAGIARLDADLTMARHYSEVAERLLADVDDDPAGHAHLARVATTNSLAATLFWHGDIPGAERRFTEMAEIASRDDMGRMLVNALAGLALVNIVHGRLRDGTGLAEQALLHAGPVGVLDSFQTNPAHLALAIAHLHRGDRLAARDAFVDVADRARRHDDRVPGALAQHGLAHLAIGDGDLTLAESHLDSITAMWPSWTAPPPIAAAERLLRARLSLATGDRAGAQAHSSALGEHPDDAFDTTLASVLLGAHLDVADARQGAPFEAAAVLALNGGRPFLAVEAHLEAAIAYRRDGNASAALRCITAAIETARGEDLRGPFLERADAIRSLLLLVHETGGPAPRSFANDVLGVLGVPPASGEELHPRGILSAREQTVYRLLASAMSNAEIASTLDITPNTLKTHVRNVYRKLGVTTRTEARAIASTAKSLAR